MREEIANQPSSANASYPKGKQQIPQYPDRQTPRANKFVPPVREVLETPGNFAREYSLFADEIRAAYGRIAVLGGSKWKEISAGYLSITVRFTTNTFAESGAACTPERLADQADPAQVKQRPTVRSVYSPLKTLLMHSSKTEFPIPHHLKYFHLSMKPPR